jgi:methylisocitrate lyase
MNIITPPKANGRRTLRELLPGGIHPVLGVYNPYSALVAQQAGFPAAYLSGAALSGSLAMPDLGLITLDELLFMVRAITRVTSIPLIVDADTGFGEALNVMRTARELETAGASAIQIEDQEMPKKCGHLEGKRVVEPITMVQKIKAVAQARRSEDFLIIARTDARATGGLDEAIRRARIYQEAGADIIFPEALESRDEFRRFSREVKAPLLANMTEFGKSPLLTLSELERMGYRFVLYPVTLFRVASKAMVEAARTIISEGGQQSLLPRMQTREDFYESISYREYERIDREIARLSSEHISKTSGKNHRRPKGIRS